MWFYNYHLLPWLLLEHVEDELALHRIPDKLFLADVSISLLVHSVSVNVNTGLSMMVGLVVPDIWDTNSHQIVVLLYTGQSKETNHNITDLVNINSSLKNWILVHSIYLVHGWRICFQAVKSLQLLTSAISIECCEDPVKFILRWV